MKTRVVLWILILSICAMGHSVFGTYEQDISASIGLEQLDNKSNNNMRAYEYLKNYSYLAFDAVAILSFVLIFTSPIKKVLSNDEGN